MMESLIVRAEVEIAAPLETVWPFVGTAEGLGRWFRAKVVMETHPGGFYEEIGSHDGINQYRLAGSVVSIDPPNEVVLSCRVEDEEMVWPVYTTLTMRLTESEGRTMVSIEQSGFENLPEEYRVRMSKGFTSGWNQTMPHLAVVVKEALLQAS
jgi:uncharacterized protein YndB with AHSA1/START domain